MQRRTLLKAFALSASVVAMGMSFGVQAADTIKVGIMHSLSGTMAISETPLKDVALMTIDEINAKGGVLGKKLEPVVVDPASNWPLFAEKARQLLSQDKVAVVFGCWTSVSRKSVLPVFEELNGLLFYPVQYEGEEMSPNVRSCIRKALRIRTSKRFTPHLVIATTRRLSPTSRNSPQAAKLPWSRPSMAIPTCRSIKSWQTRG